MFLEFESYLRDHEDLFDFKVPGYSIEEYKKLEDDAKLFDIYRRKIHRGEAISSGLVEGCECEQRLSLEHFKFSGSPEKNSSTLYYFFPQKNVLSPRKKKLK